MLICRSISKFFNSLLTLLSSLSGVLNAIALTETWLNVETDDLYRINGYDFVCKNRLSKTVAFFLSIDLEWCVRDDHTMSNTCLECIIVETTQKDISNILLGSVYRPPNSEISAFNTVFSGILEIINCNSCIYSR